MSQSDVLSFYSSESCHLSKKTLKSFGGLFDISYRRVHVRKIFTPFKKVWRLDSVYNHSTLQRLCSVFLFDFSKLNLYPFAIYPLDLLWLKLVCFMVAKICRFLAFIDKISEVYLVLKPFSLAELWKNSKYWSSCSKPSLSYWTYIPKECLVILRQGKMLNFPLQFNFKFQHLTNLILINECFVYLFLKIILFDLLIFKSSIFNLPSCTAFLWFLFELRHFNHLLNYFKDSYLFKLLASGSWSHACIGSYSAC